MKPIDALYKLIEYIQPKQHFCSCISSVYYQHIKHIAGWTFPQERTNQQGSVEDLIYWLQTDELLCYTNQKALSELNLIR